MSHEHLGAAAKQESNDGLVKQHSKRNALVNQITPLSLVPISSANAMLVLSSKLRFSFDPQERDCYFPLPEFILVTGTVSLSIIVLGVIVRHILNWIMQNKVVTTPQERLIKCLRVLGKTLSVVQVCLLFSGTLLLFSHVPYVVMEQKAGESRSDYYCDYQLVMFSGVLLGMSWILILLAAICYVFVKYCSCCKTNADDNKTS